MGLPTTLAAFFFANVIIYEQWIAHSFFANALKPERIAFMVTIIALLMISSVKFPSIKYVKMKLTTGGILVIAAGISAWCLAKGYPLFLACTALYIIINFLVSMFKDITHSWWP